MLELLKDMKKVAEDAKTVTMQHPKGHTIILVTKKLPAIQKEALKRLPLAEGGEIRGVHKSEYDKPAKEIKNKYEKHNAGESKAGEHVRKYQEANSFQKNLSREEAIDAHHKVLGELTVQPKAKLQGLAEGGMAHYDEGTPNQPVSNADAINSLPQLQDPEMGAQPVAAQAPMAQAPAPSAQIGNGSVGDVYGQAGAALNTVQQQNAENRQSLSSAYGSLQKWMQDPENAADADQYRKSMTLPSKVATGIGLFLGGFSVPFGGQNFAQDFLNKQIQNNIDMQKENYGRQKNLWGAAKDLFGDNQVADNFTKAALLDQVKDQVFHSALSNNTPGAAPRAAVIGSKLDAQKEQLHNDSAQIMTNKNQTAQQAQNQPPKQSFWDKVKYNLYNNPSEGFGAPASAPQAQDKGELDKNVPQTDPVPQFSIDAKGINQSQMLGAEGVPGQISPGEVSGANAEMEKASQLNDKIKLIHDNFGTLWKNRSDSNAALKYLSNLGANVGGAHLSLPDMTAWTPQAREYFRSASTIENELSGLVGSGGLTEAQANTIRTKLIKEGDTPDEYRNVLKSIDNNMISNLQTPILTTKYGKIKRPQIK